MYSKFFSILALFVRLCCLALLIVGGFTIPQIWKLDTSDYTREGNTVYIPLEICEPTTISVDGNAVLFDGDDIGKCHQLNYLVNACIASVYFAGGAILVFFLFDSLERCNIGPISRPSVVGMSFFLGFSLLQCAACCWALYKNCQYWEGYFARQYEKLGSSDVVSVETYGKKLWFFVTAILSLCCTGILLIEVLLSFCLESHAKNPRIAKPEQAPTRNVQSTPSPVVESEEPPKPSAWTNV